jgi:hypothetical protein
VQIGDPALADLTLNGVQFNVSSPVLPAIPANAESSPYGTTLFAQVANGSSSVQLSQNMPIATASGADTSVEMGDMSTNSTVTISVSGRVGHFRHLLSLLLVEPLLQRLWGHWRMCKPEPLCRKAHDDLIPHACYVCDFVYQAVQPGT